MSSQLQASLRLITIVVLCLAIKAVAGQDESVRTPSYVKFPFEKRWKTVDTDGLAKRDSSSINVTLVNQVSMYVVKLQIGTPPQEVYVQLDTGSSDLYVIDQGSKNCEASSDSHSSVVTDNYELTATASEDPQTATSNPDYFTPCSYYGTFDANSSSTFETNDTAFFISYGDDSWAYGIYGQDKVLIGNQTLQNATFAVSEYSSDQFGTMGISIKEAEASGWSDANRTAFYYENFPLLMKQQGLIERVVYSLYLNQESDQFGNVLFGAVNNKKYAGTLYTVPMLQVMMQPNCSATGMFVTVNSVAIEDSDSGNRTVSTTQFPAVLDSGTTYGMLPPEVADSIAKGIGASYSKKDGAYKFDCDRLNDTRLSFDFGGFNISCNISNFVQSIGEYCLLQISPSTSPPVLGDAFLSDAYVVYDLENLELSIAQANFESDEEDIEVVTGTVPGATTAPGYSNTWVYRSDDPIGRNYFTSSRSGGSLTRTGTATSATDSHSTLSSSATSATDSHSTHSSSAKNLGQIIQPSFLSFLFTSVIYALLN